MKILDIGCGPADILAYLPNVDYYGFDVSEKYIHHAHKKYGKYGSFQCKEIQISDLVVLPPFDVVLGLGLLHHLDDVAATAVIRLAAMALKENGRLITIDPCLEPSQNPIAHYLICIDRGQNVRDKKGYELLVKTAFSSTLAEVHHQSWVPYTHLFMECQKSTKQQQNINKILKQ